MQQLIQLASRLMPCILPNHAGWINSQKKKYAKLMSFYNIQGEYIMSSHVICSLSAPIKNVAAKYLRIYFDVDAVKENDMPQTTDEALIPPLPGRE